MAKRGDERRGDGSLQTSDGTSTPAAADGGRTSSRPSTPAPTPAHPRPHFFLCFNIMLSFRINSYQSSRVPKAFLVVSSVVNDTVPRGATKDSKMAVQKREEDAFTKWVIETRPEVQVSTVDVFYDQKDE